MIPQTCKSTTGLIKITLESSLFSAAFCYLVEIKPVWRRSALQWGPWCRRCDAPLQQKCEPSQTQRRCVTNACWMEKNGVVCVHKCVTWRARFKAEAWGNAPYICPNISHSWGTIGPKSYRSVRTDLSKTPQTACEEKKGVSQFMQMHWFHMCNCHHWIKGYLHHLWVTKPFTKDGLNQREHLLEDNHNLHIINEDCSHFLQSKTINIWFKLCMISCKLTGFGGLCEGESLRLASPSETSEWVLMSRVENKLDSIPRMCMMLCLLEAFGCKEDTVFSFSWSI